MFENKVPCLYLEDGNWRLLFILTLHDGGPYVIEISPLICRANKWTGFYMIGTSVMEASL